MVVFLRKLWLALQRLRLIATIVNVATIVNIATIVTRSGMTSWCRNKTIVNNLLFMNRWYYKTPFPIQSTI